ncbi:hypothetical protein T492DRAFT_879303 [Pavlovales sp. CCMP2436]|nr:hypothetical protein T492DRAFT_879303 [Pavlovales sp. CCMP2436]
MGLAMKPDGLSSEQMTDILTALADEFSVGLETLVADFASIGARALRNIGGGGAAHGGADDDGTEEWAEGVYHQRQETRSWHEAA